MGQYGSKPTEPNTNDNPGNPGKRRKIQNNKEDCERTIQTKVIFENHKSKNGLDIVCASDMNESEHEKESKVTGSYTDKTSNSKQTNKFDDVKPIEESSTYAACNDFSLHSVHTVLDVDCKQTCTYEQSSQDTEHLRVHFQRRNENLTYAVLENAVSGIGKEDKQERRDTCSSSNKTPLKETIRASLKLKDKCPVFKSEKNVEKTENQNECNKQINTNKEIIINFLCFLFQRFMKANNVREFLTNYTTKKRLCRISTKTMNRVHREEPLLQYHVVKCGKIFIWILFIPTLCSFYFNCLKDTTMHLIPSKSNGVGKMSREFCLKQYGNKFDVTINQTNISAYVIGDSERIQYELARWRSSAEIQSILGNETRKQIHIKSEAFRLATFSFYDHVYLPGKTIELAKKGFYCDLDGRIRCVQCSQEYNETHQGNQSVRCEENSDVRHNSIAESYGRHSTDYIFGHNQRVIDLRECSRVSLRSETYLVHQVMRKGTVTPVPDDVGSAEFPLPQITFGTDRSLTIHDSVRSVYMPESSNPISLAPEVSKKCTHVRSGCRTTAMQNNDMNEMLERYLREQANGESRRSINNRVLENQASNDECSVGAPETLVQLEGSNNALLSGSESERPGDVLNMSNTRPTVNYLAVAHRVDQLRHASDTPHMDTEHCESSTGCVNSTFPVVESNFNRALDIYTGINCNDRTQTVARRVPAENSSLSDSQDNAELYDNTVNEIPEDILPSNGCCLTQSESDVHSNESLTPHPSIFERGNAQVYSETNQGSLLQSASLDGNILQTTEYTILNENDSIETLAVQLESLSIEGYVTQGSSRRLEVLDEPINDEEPKTT